MPFPKKRPPLALLLLAALLAGCSGGSSGSASNAGGGGGSGTVVAGDVLSYPFTGTKRVLLVIVGLADTPPLFAPSDEPLVQDIAETLSTAYAKNSLGGLQLEVDYTWPPLSIPKNFGDYDQNTAFIRIRSDALAVARSAGYDPDQYDREAIFAPPVWSMRARGWVRTAWMPHTLPWVLYHEIGHTLGWGHANFWDGDPVGAGTEVNYGDLWDPMGTGQAWDGFRHSAPWFKQRVGWLASQEVATITSSGTYSLGPVEDPASSAAPSALRIRRDSGEDYWILHRADEELVREGLLIVRTPTDPFTGSLLLDMHRGTTGGLEQLDAALLPGESFDDTAYAGITITNVTPASAGPDDDMLVQVTLDTARQLGLDTLPAIQVVSPPRDQGPVAGTIDLQALVADPDVGDQDGDGIAQVTLSILRPLQDPFLLIDQVDLFEPPYRWSYDTTTLSDAAYYLDVTARALDGGERTIQFRFLVDNEGSPF